jgi:hypothetical protein
VLWVGGAPCAGKSTVAGIIAAARALPLYSCDDAFARHAAAITPDDGPTLKKVTALDTGARLAQPVEVQVGDVVRAYREQFPLIRRDLDGIGPAVAEGAALMPDLLAEHGVEPGRAVWIVPTEQFQRRYYTQRAWARDLVAGLEDPDGAFDRWMRRDAAFARLVADRAHALGYRVITVDGSIDITGIAASIEAIKRVRRGERPQIHLDEGLTNDARPMVCGRWRAR